MTRKRVTASEKKQRHEWAVRQIDAGMGLSELTAFTAETWGAAVETPVMSSLRPTRTGWMLATDPRRSISGTCFSSRWDAKSASPARLKMQVSFQRQSVPLLR